MNGSEKKCEHGRGKGYVREMSKTVFTGKEVTIFKLDTHAFFFPPPWRLNALHKDEENGR